MTVLFRKLRLFGYVTVFILAGGVLGIASYFASQFLPHTRYSYTVYSLVAPSVTVALLIFLLSSASRPWIDALSLLVMAISWLALAAWTSDINGPTDCFALGSSRTRTKHGTISSKAFCYEAKTVEGVSWSIFILLTFFLIFVITLANRSQVLGWPDIWNEDIIDLPWFGEYPGYPGGPLYAQGPQLENQAPQIQGGQMVVNGSVVQQQPGYSIVIWPGVNGEPPRIEQRPGIVTHSTLTL
ncbi:hypothetical protein V8E52_000615 [Russula decolorans]